MNERIELCCYTSLGTDMLNYDNSLGTGISKVEKLISRAKGLNMKALAITDFNCVLSYLEAAEAVQNSDFKIIYGVTLPIWNSTNLDNERFLGYATLLAKNKNGIKTIYELLTYVLADEKLLTLDAIINNKENLIVGSSKNMFAKQDYLVVTPYQDLEIVKETIKEGKDCDIPVVAVGDVTYSGTDDSLLKDILSETAIVIDDRPLLSTKEMLRKFEYLPKELAEEIVITNTNLIANKIENKIEPILREFCYAESNEHFEELQMVVYKKLKESYGDNPPQEVLKRIETELEFIKQPHNIAQFYIAYKLCDFAHKKGYPTGARGSTANSFAAFLLGISEINPLKYNLPYESFFGFSGNKMADIDINFPGIIQSDVIIYLKELCGENNVTRAGTVKCEWPETMVLRIAEKYLCNRQKTWNSEEQDCVANLLMNSGIKWREYFRSGAFVLFPKGYSAYDFTPLKNKDDITSTYFDFHDLCNFGLLIVDVLGHEAYTFLKELSDKTGVKIEDIPLNDEEVLELINSLDTNELPQFNTDYAKNIIAMCKPKCFDDLVKINELSHGYGLWRGNVEDLIKTGDVTLKNVVSTREDIFDYFIEHGADKKTAVRAMEVIEKRTVSERQWFQDMCIKYQLPAWWVESVCKITHMFPKAYAIVYTVLAVRIAYFKVHFPRTFDETYVELFGNDEG